MSLQKEQLIMKSECQLNLGCNMCKLDSQLSLNFKYSPVSHTFKFITLSFFHDFYFASQVFLSLPEDLPKRNSKSDDLPGSKSLVISL